MRAVGVVAAVAALAFVANGTAAWSVATGGNGSAKGGSLVGNKPTLSKSGTGTITVSVSWAATPGATAYVIGRTGGVGSIGGTCTGLVNGTSCSDTPVLTLQTYTYTVTPVNGTWTGTTSPGTTIST
jgi:hypothetical protein